MNQLLLKQEAIGATKRLGIILGATLALIVSICVFHILRELQGLPYDGGPLYDTYADFYHGIVTFAAGTFWIMCACFCLNNALSGNQQKMGLWLVVLGVTTALVSF